MVITGTSQIRSHSQNRVERDKCFKTHQVTAHGPTVHARWFSAGHPGSPRGLTTVYVRQGGPRHGADCANRRCQRSPSSVVSGSGRSSSSKTSEVTATGPQLGVWLRQVVLVQLEDAWVHGQVVRVTTDRIVVRHGEDGEPSLMFEFPMQFKLARSWHYCCGITEFLT